MVIDVDKVKLHLFLLLCIIIIEFHLSQEKLSLIVVLCLEISSLGHVPNNFSRACSSFSIVGALVVYCEISSLIFRVVKFLSGFSFKNPSV